jgi:hypothetical protein
MFLMLAAFTCSRWSPRISFFKLGNSIPLIWLNARSPGGRGENKFLNLAFVAPLVTIGAVPPSALSATVAYQKQGLPILAIAVLTPRVPPRTPVWMTFLVMAPLLTER